MPHISLLKCGRAAPDFFGDAAASPSPGAGRGRPTNHRRYYQPARKLFRNLRCLLHGQVFPRGPGSQAKGISWSLSGHVPKKLVAKHLAPLPNNPPATRLTCILHKRLARCPSAEPLLLLTGRSSPRIHSPRPNSSVTASHHRNPSKPTHQISPLPSKPQPIKPVDPNAGGMVGFISRPGRQGRPRIRLHREDDDVLRLRCAAAVLKILGGLPPGVGTGPLLT